MKCVPMGSPASFQISGIDIVNRRIETDFDEYEFDDAIIYPPVRASRLIEEGGIQHPYHPQKAANTDPFRYHLVDDERVYVTGDSRSQPFSKGGHTAHSEGQYVAEVVAAHALGREVNWRSPQTMCFSSVDIEPLRAMSIITYYKYNQKHGEFAFDRTHFHLIREINQRPCNITDQIFHHSASLGSCSVSNLDQLAFRK